MQIRTRLTLQFLLLGGLIMVFSSAAIYISSAQFRRDDFYNRLRNKARLIAGIVLESENPDTGKLMVLKKDYPYNLHNEKIVILNYLNNVVYSSDSTSSIKIRYDILERIRLYQKMFYKQGDYEVMGTLYNTKRYRYVVLAAASDVEGINQLRKLRTIIAIVCASSLLLFFFAGKLFAGKAIQPINKVIEKVEEISITSLDLRVPEGNGRDEIGRLARTFNNMLSRLQVSFRMQKDFIANASHELRTPLTSINGQLEVLIMKDRTTDEYKSTVGSVLDDIKSMSDLTNRLLLLAKTTENQSVTRKPVRLDEVLWQVKDDLRRFRTSYRMNISLDSSFIDEGQMTTYGDDFLIRTAFLNLADNACKYSSDNQVNVTLRNSDEKVAVIFDDRGCGIPENEIKKIMEPFYRASEVKNIPGHGIGLPLVNQIITIHHGKMEISSREGVGTTVTVLLPVAVSQA